MQAAMPILVRAFSEPVGVIAFVGKESIVVDLFKTEQYDPKYLKLNPEGVVPTLVHDGKVTASHPARVTA
jgi:glutathione S-transferase